MRVQNASDYNEVMAENLSAANSRISDTDYASEVTNMVAEKIRIPSHHLSDGYE